MRNRGRLAARSAGCASSVVARPTAGSVPLFACAITVTAPPGPIREASSLRASSVPYASRAAPSVGGSSSPARASGVVGERPGCLDELVEFTLLDRIQGVAETVLIDVHRQVGLGPGGECASERLKR